MNLSGGVFSFHSSSESEKQGAAKLRRKKSEGEEGINPLPSQQD
jgi:hypothetical protein